MYFSSSLMMVKYPPPSSFFSLQVNNRQFLLYFVIFLNGYLCRTLAR
nr:MAG TPA: hypothetical protein [Caudoviricetes sp.]